MHTTNNSRKNLIIVLTLVFICMIILCGRVGYLQIVRGDELSEMALERQTKDRPIEADRGTIYDRNGEKLAVSVKCYTVYVTPAEVGNGLKKSERRAEQGRVAKQLADILELDEQKVYNKVTSEYSQVKVIKGIDKATANQIRDKKLSGVTIMSDTKRSYPNGNMASKVLGLVNEDNVGQSGLELQYNKYLSGVAGRWVDYTDNTGRNQLSYSSENSKYYQSEDGYNLYTTIDEVIQSYTEDALENALKNTKAERAMAIVMDPETGDVLAMAQKPDFDPNNAYEPSDPEEKDKFDALSGTEQSEYLSNMWRNFLVSDVYEPGSVFKLLTTSIALEEDETSLDSTFNCVGVLNVAGTYIHCWDGSGHGEQNLKQAVGNSCNPVFMTLATKIGIEKFYDYLENFGITGQTEIDLPSEGMAIMQSEESAGPVGLATIGFGQGVAVTPIQLITAVSSIGNEGNLMKPRLVKEIKDSKGNVVKEIEPTVLRQTISKETAEEMCDIMTYVVEEGGGGAAAVKGYTVGAKTGTANKAKKGGYSSNTYSSCLAMAPMEDPKLAVLVIVDSPKGVKYGSVTAAPAVGTILDKSLKHLNIAPKVSEEEIEAEEAEKIAVPDLTGESAENAIGILEKKGLSFDMSKAAQKLPDFMVVDQYPSPGTKVKPGTKVYLYN